MPALSFETPLAALARFTDPHAMSAVLRERLPGVLGCTVVYARCRTYLKPTSWHKSFLCVCYRCEIAGGAGVAAEPRLLYAKVYLDGRSRREYQKLGAQPGGAAHWPDLDMIVWSFPDDPRLPQLPELVDGGRVISHLPHAALSLQSAAAIKSVAVEVVHYRPEQRCLLRYDIRLGRSDERLVVYGKAFAYGEQSTAVFDRMQYCYAMLKNRLDGVRVARPLGYDARLRTVWQEGIAGIPLAAAVSGGDYREPMAAIGRCLAFLHASAAPVQDTTTREARLADACKKARKLGLALPALARDLNALSERLALEIGALPPAHESVIHGDMHFGQLLVAGGEVVLFDFDEWSRGDPAQDLADFSVDPHISQFERDSGQVDHARVPDMLAVMLASYRRHAVWPVSDAAIAWHARVQLINKAYRAYIQQELFWRDKLPVLVALALSLEKNSLLSPWERRPR